MPGGWWCREWAVGERRSTGLQPPWTAESRAVLVAESGFTALAVSAIAVCCSSNWYTLPLAVYAGITAVVLMAWLVCTTMDPAPPQQTTPADARYCRLCKKSVPGLDHHCMWLNTCIGSCNYPAFFILAWAGTLQHACAVAFCVAVATSTAWGRQSPPLTDGEYAHLAIAAACGAIGVACFGALATFHTYLRCFRGIGTYEWLVERAAARRKLELIREEDVARRVEQLKLRASSTQPAPDAEGVSITPDGPTVAEDGGGNVTASSGGVRE